MGGPQRTTRVSSPGPCRVAQAQRLALDRAHGHARLLGQADRRPRPRAGGDDDLRSRDALAARERDARHPATVVLHALDGDTGAQHRAGALGRARERRDQQPGVDGVVAGDVEGQAQRGRERGLQPARRRGQQALGASAPAARAARARAPAPLPRRGRARRRACRRRRDRRRCPSARAARRRTRASAARCAARARAARARPGRPRSRARACPRPPTTPRRRGRRGRARRRSARARERARRRPARRPLRRRRPRRGTAAGDGGCELLASPA